MQKRILCAWLGNSDVKEAARRESGPILSALRKSAYHELLLLSAQPKADSELYLAWLAGQVSTPVSIRYCPLADPTDFAEIYAAAKAALVETRRLAGGETSFTYHLSPGTQAMGSVWTILAYSHFPGNLIQAHRETGVKDVVLPFDTVADFMPQFLGQTKAAFVRNVTDKPASELFGEFGWRTPALAKVIGKARHLALYDEIPLLILGESGTGKEEMAQFIHRLSTRKAREPVVLNCGAIPATLIESELFGSVKGAFTGASDRPGCLERADGSTLFLDEVGEMPADAQVKLLRALQQRSFNRVGGNRAIECDFRLVCATNRNLMAEVAAGRFREDLFYRIAGAIVELPPLRLREEDLVPFAELQLAEINRKFLGKPGYLPKSIGDSARAILFSHGWPGNIRELISALKSAAIWTEGKVIEAEELRAAIITIDRSAGDIFSRPLGSGFALDGLLDQLQKHYLIQGMSQAGNNLKRATELLGFDSYQTLTIRLKKFGLHQAKWKRGAAGEPQGSAPVAGGPP